MTRRGRKAVPASVPLVVWVLVELMRDRKEPGRPRDSERHACEKVSAHLKACFLGGREFETETVRTYYKRFKLEMKRSNSGERAQMAGHLLADARFRRDMFGWEQSTWSLVINPGTLEALGYSVDFSSNANS